MHRPNPILVRFCVLNYYLAAAAVFEKHASIKWLKSRISCESWVGQCLNGIFFAIGTCPHTLRLVHHRDASPFVVPVAATVVLCHPRPFHLMPHTRHFKSVHTHAMQQDSVSRPIPWSMGSSTCSSGLFHTASPLFLLNQYLPSAMPPYLSSSDHCPSPVITTRVTEPRLFQN